MNSTNDERAATLERMAKQKGYFLDDWLKKVGKPLTEVVTTRRIELLKHLLTLEDKKGA